MEVMESKARALRVEETNPFKVELAFNNYQSPTVEAERGLVMLAHHDLTGHGSGVDRSHRGSGACPAFSFQRGGEALASLDQSHRSPSPCSGAYGKPFDVACQPS
jgi:hypothetical protein